MSGSGATALARLRARPCGVGTGPGCRQMAGCHPSPSHGTRLGMQLQPCAKAAAGTPDFWLLRSGGNRDRAEVTVWGALLPTPPR